MQSAVSPIYICATARLGRALLNTIHQRHVADSSMQWHAPQIYTLPQWLQQHTSTALLSGHIPTDYFPINNLNSFTEKLLWQEAIETCLARHELADLFDIPNLAQSAIVANQRLIEWQINEAQLNAYFISNETRQFLRWRNAFLKLCEQHDSIEPARLLKLQIDAITNTKCPLLEHIQFLGFDRITPLEQCLIAALELKGVTVELISPNATNHNIRQIGLDDINAECRAAVAWAKQHLVTNPNAKLAIVSPVLANIRRPLSDLLDDTFHPETRHSSLHEAPRIYDFSLGLALGDFPMVRTALNLLQLSTSGKTISQTDITALLLDVYWSALHELDDRSLLDAQMRKRLSRSLNLHDLLTLISKNAMLKQLRNDIEHILVTQQDWSQKQRPSVWAQRFSKLLQALNWSQTRALSSHEYQTRQAWLETIGQLTSLDKLLGTVSAADALQKLQQLCSNTIFQPEADSDTRIQVLGMLESTTEVLDGIWVIGMNDQHWPQPADPNPLLPIKLQHALQTPGANPDAQAEFAKKVYARLCSSAAEIVFSWSKKDGDRELRPSPLLNTSPTLRDVILVQTMTETLAAPIKMQMIEDYVAPPIQTDEQLRGGSNLFEAQAICPAWAFYQYRLGAKKLESPSEGLDNMTRGNLVHSALQQFWLACQDSQTLLTSTPKALAAMVSDAIDKALMQLQTEHAINLPKQVTQIEQHRLFVLLQAWLEIEKQRTGFSVKACEAAYPLHIEGIEIVCRIDRIDTLENGDLIVIDYKTGASLPAIRTWAEQRIHEPQLPLYAAALALKNEHVAAVSFAKVNIDECRFNGLSAEAGILPKVSALEHIKRDSAFNSFQDFSALITYWQASLASIAIEIKTGVASVVFENEMDLMYCDVKPLLRLPERELQFEQENTHD